MVIKAPKAKSADDCERLEQLPNIGPSLLSALVRSHGPAPGPVRARHLHGGHRLHARRAGGAVVELHRPTQGDFRRHLTAAVRTEVRNWPVRPRFLRLRHAPAIKQSAHRLLPAKRAQAHASVSSPLARVGRQRTPRRALGGPSCRELSALGTLAASRLVVEHRPLARLERLVRRGHRVPAGPWPASSDRGPGLGTARFRRSSLRRTHTGVRFAPRSHRGHPLAARALAYARRGLRPRFATTRAGRGRRSPGFARRPLPEAHAPRRLRGAGTVDRRRGGLALRQRAEIVHLAELDAVVTQERVRRRHVEEEIRQGEVL